MPSPDYEAMARVHSELRKLVMELDLVIITGFQPPRPRGSYAPPPDTTRDDFIIIDGAYLP